MGKYETLGTRVGKLVDTKNAAYGNSFNEAGDFLKILYPNGIQPNQYNDMLCLVRVFDKMKRIATDKDALGESPYQDITGYGLLGLERIEAEKAAKMTTTSESETSAEAEVVENAKITQNDNSEPSNALPKRTHPSSVDKFLKR